MLKKKICFFLITPALLFVYAGMPAQSWRHPPKKQKLILGINGHAIGERAPYNNPINIQLSQIRAMGLTYYRNDVSVKLDGTVNNSARFEELLKKAAAYRIKILPMVYDCWKPELSKKQNYANGYSLGLGFTRRYGKSLSAIDIGNEKDVLVMRKDNPGAAIPPDGQLTDHYQRPLINSLAACLRGMTDGIHKVNRDIKVIISCSNHPRWGYFKILQEQGVAFDIVGVHWYTSSGDIANIYGQNGLKMFAQFNKPIWVTEFNRGGGNFRENGVDNEANMLGGFVGQILAYPMVQTFFVYELYDDPVSKKQDNAEGFFGVYNDPLDAKPAVSALKNMSSQHK